MFLNQFEPYPITLNHPSLSYVLVKIEIETSSYRPGHKVDVFALGGGCRMGVGEETRVRCELIEVYMERHGTSLNSI